MHGAKALLPRPALEYGWSGERSEVVGGQERGVFCLTGDDRRRLYNYIYLLEFEVSRD